MEEEIVSVAELNTLPLEDIKMIVQKLLQENELLAEESIIYENFFQKNQNTMAATISDENANLSLSNELKIDIVTKEIEELKSFLELESKEFEKRSQAIKSELQSIEIHWEELQKELTKWTATKQWCLDMYKQKKEQLQKLELRNNAQKLVLLKLKKQMEQREETGEVLSKIDFDQLKIENDQMLLQLHDKTNELKHLKISIAQTQTYLTLLQNKLKQCNDEVEEKKKLVSDQTKELINCKIDMEQVLKEKNMANRKHAKLVYQKETTKVPFILEYVQMKKDLDTMKRDIKDWQRKLEIMQGTEKVNRYKYSLLKRAEEMGML